MKFPQGYEVQLVRPNSGAAYADLTHGADRYVVGIADQPFEVRYTVPRAQFVSSHVRARLRVDGTDWDMQACECQPPFAQASGGSLLHVRATAPPVSSCLASPQQTLGTLLLRKHKVEVRQAASRSPSQLSARSQATILLQDHQFQPEVQQLSTQWKVNISCNMY